MQIRTMKLPGKGVACLGPAKLESYQFIKIANCSTGIPVKILFN